MKRLLKTIKIRVNKLWALFFARLKPLPNTVMFSSFVGLYNDNPKYLSEKLHELYPDIHIVWEQANKSHEIFPDYVTKVKTNSIKAWYYFSRANVVVNNQLTVFNIEILNGKLSMLIKNKYTTYISTQHGVPLKTIGLDIPYLNVSTNNFGIVEDLIFASNQYEAHILEKCLNYQVPVIGMGYPRNDILFDINEDKRKQLRDKLELPQACKLLLYCPTYRGDINIDGCSKAMDSGVIQLTKMNIPNVLKNMKKKFGGEWKLVFRAHHTAVSLVDYSNNIDIIPGNVGDDMAEYLSCCDSIITDYSGSLFDICLTEIPCFLYAHDREDYIKERGIYMNIEDLPFKFADTSQQLIDNILSYSREKDMKSKKDFLNKLGSYDDGRASEREAEFIADILYNRRKLEEMISSKTNHI